MAEIRFHKNDLPDLSHYDVGAVAIDTETLGLNPHRDRLCVVQISPGDGTADVIQIAPGQKKAPICTMTCAAQTIATRRRALALSVVPGVMTLLSRDSQLAIGR